MRCVRSRRFGGLLSSVLAFVIIVAVACAMAKRNNRKKPLPELGQTGAGSLDALNRKICGRRLTRKPPGLEPKSISPSIFNQRLHYPVLFDSFGEDRGKTIPPQDPRTHGRRAYDGEFPWFVFMQSQWPSGNWTECGGIVINRNLILTAAQCLKSKGKLDPRKIHVYASMDPKDPAKWQNMTGAQIMWPSKNNPRSRKRGTQEIGLVKLSGKLKYNKRVQPACLPEKGSELREQSGCAAANLGGMFYEKEPRRFLASFMVSTPLEMCKSQTEDFGQGVTCFETSNRDLYNGRGCQYENGDGLMCPGDPGTDGRGKFYVVGVSSKNEKTFIKCGHTRFSEERSTFADVEMQLDELHGMARKLLGGKDEQ